MRPKFTIFRVVSVLILPVAPAMADGSATVLPACALSGATSVMFNGRPALRLGDVVNCPPELYEIVQSVMIEGQPMVTFKAGATEKAACAAKGSADIAVEGQAAQRLGDVSCASK